MSVPELLKTAVPIPMTQSESVLPDVIASAKQLLANLGTPATPLRPKIQQPLPSILTVVSSDVPGTPRGKAAPKTPEEFYKDLQQFHERRNTPVMHMPKISGRVVDLLLLYNEVTERGGFLKVNMRDEWEEVLPALGLHEKCVNATAAVKHIYRRHLEKYERLNFFGEDPDKMEALEALENTVEGGRSRVRYPSILHGSGVNTVPMSYNYRQHVVNMDRRRTYRLSTDLHKPSPYEKLMLSLMSPLPNEQDFAINVCTLMANESKHTLKLNEFPKLLDVLLAHTGIFPDLSMRQLFQHVYTDVRRHSLSSFWRDLLRDKPQILELCNEEPSANNELDVDMATEDNVKSFGMLDEYLSSDFLNLGRGEGTQDYIGQRVQQVAAILRNLSFFDENLLVFAKNRTFMRFLVMSANIRWGNIHTQALDIAGNVATELELQDPTSDDLSRSLMATLCDGVEGMDRGVIINSLEILNKLCQKDSNEEYIHKCLNLKFYQTLCLFLSLNDIMLLIFTLEAIYALTSMGARSCHLIMQVRGVIDQLVSLITVEAQSYGPDGCILMRVVETVPGNMLPMVAQNIANLQNVAVIQKTHQPAPQQQLHEAVGQSQHAHTEITPAPTSQPPQQQQPAQQPQPQLQMPTNFTHEDEQYALAWLGATFERAASVDSHVEQQELYRMYLSHCQKSGKHSVVNHLQFPRLVRLIFNNAVGPVVVRRTDGTELPGFHYVAIRVRAQPLPIQSKSSSQSLNAQKLANDCKLASKIGETIGSSRKAKKKLKLQPDLSPQPQQSPSMEGKQDVVTPTLSATPTSIIAPNESPKTTVVTKFGSGTSPKIEEGTPLPPATVVNTQASHIVHHITADEPQASFNNPTEDTNIPKAEEAPKPSTSVQQQAASLPQLQQQANDSAIGNNSQSQQQPSSSLIKSLLANKVTQRQQKQKEHIAAATTASQSTTHSSVLSTVATSQTQPIKVASTAISALVNNPLMQNTSVKVGQTTIKPLNPQVTLEKKQLVDSAPPPLAPLSGNNVAKDASGRPVIIANQMLVEILDKKTVDPPIPATIVKRKNEETSNIGTESAKRLALDAAVTAKDETQATPSKNAANLYAEMAASILEDEDLDDIPPLPVSTTAAEQLHQPSLINIPAKIHQQTPNMQNVQRQLVFQTNQSPQLKLTTSNPSCTSQIPTAMATIKTDQGLQTVPVILQQKPMDQTQPQLIQQVLQQSAAQVPQQTTQYVLATNPQGQTYLVAQQSQPTQPPPPPTQTVLVTQTPQQQSAGTKTIIILQQQALPTSQAQQQQLISTAGGAGPQKMIMTTPQGQQVLVTQRHTQPTMCAPTQQQIFINPQTGAATHIQHVPVSGSNNIGGNLMQRQLIQSSQSHQLSAQQMSPSLLSQLNHIPATIKLHQPQPVLQQQQPQPQQSATISRIGKSVSIVQTTPSLPPPPPIQIPQLQQHQSIIQQHIISGPAEKRQVILGGRAIEIKETVITQAAPPPQQSQLNSQTIITKQPQIQPLAPLQQQQQQQTQQQIRSVLEQQQQHPSIIQQKISLPLQTNTAQAQLQTQVPTPAASPSLIPQKINEYPPNLVQSTLQTKTMPQAQTVVQTLVQQPGVASQTSLATIKKPVTSQQIVAQVKALPQTGQQSILPTLAPKPSIEPPPLAVAQSKPTSINSLQKDQPDAAKEIKAIEIPTSIATTVSTALIMSSMPTPTLPMLTPAAASSPTLVSQPAPAPTPPLQLQQLQQQQVQLQGQPVDANWLYVCDWRNCPRRKFKSVNDLHHHACSVHCPDHLDAAAEIFCQWGPGPSLCDGIPRKRYSLMTHIVDRHLTPDSLRNAMQRRIAMGTVNIQPAQAPVTIVRNMDQSQRNSTASPALSTSSSSSLPSTGSSAIQAIKRHTADFVNPKELMDENEGPVTKSIRLTAALILRNLVTYTSTAKRNLRRYEPHLANVALSNVESSGAISHILFELNN